MNALNGFINLDKPLNMSSALAVDVVKRILNLKKLGIKIGHAGTLDPLATGVLVLAVGKATKRIQEVQDALKQYEFTVTWGEERNTDDGEGEVVATSDKRPTLADIEAILPEFTGDIMQTPPVYSAIKMGGKRAYDMARAGETVEMKARMVRVLSLSRAEPRDLQQVEGDPSTSLRSAQDKFNTTTFKVTCSKGTYIRSLAHDFGRKLGVYGYVSMLRRTAVGSFRANDAISLENLEELVHKGDLSFIGNLG